MILYRTCPLCHSEQIEGYAIDCKRPGPHISRTRCRDCGVVFANPMANPEELAAYYAGYYEKDRFGPLQYKELMGERIERITRLSREQVFKEAKFMAPMTGTENFLDIGCGLGQGLAYAHQVGFQNLYATEFDQGAIDHVTTQFQARGFMGDLLAARYPSDFFDMIHISHVIEHVSDPHAYLDEMFRITRPGGIVAIGTPDISSRLYVWYRYAKMLNFKIPLVIDGLEHTFIFPSKLLARLCRDHGFAIQLHYGVGLKESMRNLLKYDISLPRKIARYLQNFFKINQWLVVQKPVTE